MTPEPRRRHDYSPRQTEAARRVLIDLGQVLASFSDCVVIIGGWVPDLLLPDASEPHVGSIDIDIALDAEKLNDGRYAALLKLLMDTGRYKKGKKDFQLMIEVDLKDGEKPVIVDVDFLAPAEIKLKKNNPKLMKGFRVLQADGCAAAFNAPVELKLTGKNVRGDDNTVTLFVASLPDSLVMKAHAIGGRDKPKDVYDLCYEFAHNPDGLEALAANWKQRIHEADVAKAVQILKEKFTSVKAFGPQQLAEFHNPSTTEENEMEARHAYEWVQKFLRLLE